MSIPAKLRVSSRFFLVTYPTTPTFLVICRELKWRNGGERHSEIGNNNSSFLKLG
jgi:hypothetical protein